jgi:hypothetical protein
MPVMPKLPKYLSGSHVSPHRSEAPSNARMGWSGGTVFSLLKGGRNVCLAAGDRQALLGEDGIV